MYHPTTRVLTILELLQAHPQLSGAELAARLEVDRRSVRRYIVMLQDLGIPIETTRGNRGGYRLRAGFKLPPLMLTDAEALAITVSLEAARRQGLSVDGAAVTGALTKIERVLPEALRSELQSLRAAVTSAPYAPTPQPASDLLRLVGAGITRHERIRLRYAGAKGDGARDEQSERAVDPYGLVCHWGYWYLVGWCRLRDDLRIFRLDRVAEATPTAERFVPPADVDPLHVVLERLALAPRRWQIDVILEANLEVAQALVVPGTALLEPVEGGVRFRATADSLKAAARTLASFGCPLSIREPVELRAELRRLATTLLAAATKGEDAPGSDSDQGAGLNGSMVSTS
jgi:predicted DNA-binding transcriptional regulator YafY